MKHGFTLPSGKTIDIDYFIEWRPLLWRRPLLKVLGFLGDLQGLRVLEIGGRSGRITSLLAMMGASVTMLETAPLDTARKEIESWGVQDRVRLVKTKGGVSELGTEKFDVIFTKSVLWMIEDLDTFLGTLDAHLAPGGRIAFIENNLGGRFIRWFRRRIIHRGKFGYESVYFGMHPGQFVYFENRFDGLEITRHYGLIYSFTGRKRDMPA